MQATAAYTYTDSQSSIGQEARRAKDIASINIAWQAKSDVNVNLNIQYNGTQFDYPPAKAYTLVDLNTNIKATDNLDMYMNLTNLFDEDYQDVAGYETLGFGLSAGFRYKLK